MKDVRAAVRSAGGRRRRSAIFVAAAHQHAGHLSLYLEYRLIPNAAAYKIVN